MKILQLCSSFYLVVWRQLHSRHAVNVLFYFVEKVIPSTNQTTFILVIDQVQFVGVPHFSYLKKKNVQDTAPTQLQSITVIRFYFFFYQGFWVYAQIFVKNTENMMQLGKTQTRWGLCSHYQGLLFPNNANFIRGSLHSFKLFPKTKCSMESQHL